MAVRSQLGVLSVAVAVGLIATPRLFGQKAETRSDAAFGPGQPTKSVWHILRQPNTMALMHGLPQRLLVAQHEKADNDLAWRGVDNGGSLTLGVSFGGNASGEVTVGFFTDPQWWVADPVQVRALRGGGVHRIERLRPGKYYIGAMTGSLSKMVAGVHRTWPQPVAIKAGERAKSRVLLSPDFTPMEFGLRKTTAASLAGDWPKLKKEQLVKVKVVDENGDPIPFTRVTIVGRLKKDPKKVEGFYNVSTDRNGLALSDDVDGPFTVMFQVRDFTLDPLGSRYRLLALPDTYQSRDNPVITAKAVPWPSGRGVVTGRAHDQHGRPVTGFHVDLMTKESINKEFQGGNFGQRLAVVSTDGTFRVDGLKSGKYRLRAFAFDYPAYVYEEYVDVDVPAAEAGPVHVDFKIEAKHQYFGRAVFKSGKPVYPGGWTARFSRNRQGAFGGRSFSLNTEPGGLFRVTLSQKEQQLLNANSAGKVEVYAQGQNAPRIQFPVKELSTERQKPTRVVLPDPVAK